MNRIIGMVLAAMLAGCAATSTVVQKPPVVEGYRIVEAPQHLAPLAPNGVFEVSVIMDGAWTVVGSQEFDQFVREQELKLPALESLKGEARIRLRQKGGGAAHLDAVSLDGAAPVKIDGGEGADALKKLAKQDNDLTDAFGRTMELTFNGSLKDRTLRIAGRIEPPVIGPAAFMMPADNYCTKGSGWKFYPYRLKQSQGLAALNRGVNREEKPFVKEFLRAGSGHPSSYLYGWVDNDAANLYVTLDFTGDNTKDGDKDYTKVFVNMPNGVKEFKISEQNNAWGTPRFTYTDKVAWEHKLYEFMIPLSEIGIDKAEKGKNVELAFAAYGTCSPVSVFPKSAPAIAFNSQNNQYLSVYQKNEINTCTQHVYGQLLKGDGTHLGAEITISDSIDTRSPQVAFDSINRRYMVVYQRNYSSGIYGRLFNADGSAFGAEFGISTNISGTGQPAIVFDAVNGRYLVAWRDDRNYASNNNDIFGKVLSADGTAFSAEFALTTAVRDQYNPRVAFDPVGQKYLVVWEDYRAVSFNSTVYGQLIPANGIYTANPAADILIADSTFSQTKPDVAYDNINRRFLVVWQDAEAAGDAFGQIVASDGSLVASRFNFSNTAGVNDINPRVAFDPSTQKYLAVWNSSNMLGQAIDTAGALVGSPIDFLGSKQYPALAANPVCGNTLISYVDTAVNPTDIGYIVFGPACPAGYLSAVMMESFDTAVLPSGWDNSGGWVFNGSGNNTGGTGGFAKLDNSYANDTELWTRALDLTGVAGPTVEFKTNYTGASDNLYVDVSTDSGANWTTVWSSLQTTLPATTVTKDITSVAANAGNALVRFRFAYGDGVAGYWGVDDVRVYNASANGTYTITTSATNGSISPPSAIVASNGSATFNMLADAGYHIENEAGAVIVDGSSIGSLAGKAYTFNNVAANHTLTATFVKNRYNFNLVMQGGGHGTVAGSGFTCTDATCNSLYDHGTVLTLSAIPGPYSSFAGWSGGCTGTGTCAITMSQAKSVIATFKTSCDGILVPSPTKSTPDITDALKALRIAVKLETPTAVDLLRGDVAPLVNGVPVPNGVIDLGDAIVILRRSLGLVSW